MGLGIWSMHFTGMLAFNLPVPVFYDWPTVLLSLLVAILASAVALYIVSRKKMGRVQALTGSVLIGFGIASMHYIGMAAMRLYADCHYSPLLVTASVVVAVIASLAALEFTFGYREDFRGTSLAKVTSAALMGAAIFLMHYTGMMSASFVPSTAPPAMSHAVSISSLGLSGIAIGSLLVPGAAIWTSSVDRRIAAGQARELEAGERLQQIAENLPIALALANSDFTEILYVNHAYQEIWGRTLENFYREPMSMLEGIHPEDREHLAESLRGLIGGVPIANLECRVVRPDGSISWVVCRGNTVRDARGHVHRLAGSAQDITPLKEAQEQLRRLSRRLLGLQDEERRRIARELHDSTGQNLVALATMLGRLRDLAPLDSKESRTLLSECEALLEQSIREVRTLSYVLHPRVLDEDGLEDAIRDYVEGFTKRSGIQVDLELSPRLGRLPRDVELAVFRVVQESLSNVQRHSGSQRAKIRIDRDPNLILEVSDNGRGAFGGGRRDNDGPVLEVGVGIPSMRERIRLVGGQLVIDSDSNGTIVRVTMPLAGAQA